MLLPSWMELAAAEPFDGDLRLGSDAEQGPGIRGRWATTLLAQTLWRAVGQLVSELCERDFVKSLGYMSVLNDKWREGAPLSLLLELCRCAASASRDSGVRRSCLTT